MTKKTIDDIIKTHTVELEGEIVIPDVECLCDEILRQEENEKKDLTIKKVVERILKKHNMTIEEITKKTKKGDIIKYRQCVQTLLKRNTAMSLVEIGKHIGHKDHTTVLHSVMCIKNAEYLQNKKGKPQKIVELYEEMSSQWFCLCGNEYKYKRAFE